MCYSEATRRRLERVERWFTPARFGLFYHWGLYTGGGSTRTKADEDPTPLTYPTPTALEAAVPDPTRVAKNMVQAAVDCGAKYITLTALHNEEGYCVLYPTALEGFVHHTSIDYIGAFLDEAHAAGIHPLLYIPASPCYWDTVGGPWLNEGCRDDEGFCDLMEKLIDEMAERYGDKIEGIWIDGMTPHFARIPAHIHKRLPDTLVINNNNTTLDIDDVDFGTTEFLVGTPEPTYCRPSALRTRQPKFGISAPGSDFNEDIPTYNLWWYQGEFLHSSTDKYLNDPQCLLRQMISSLGQRGQWNFAFGIGPCVDGTMPTELAPSLSCLTAFMNWGKEAIENTCGGEHSYIQPGWFMAPWAPAGFCSVTVSRSTPSTHYVLVTTAPDCDRAMFHSGGRMPSRITNLRTGEELPFTMMAGFVLDNMNWSDVDDHGVLALKVEF